MADSDPFLHGSCFCHAVSFALSSAPILSAYCHCTNCQRLTACPFVHTMHFPGDAFKWAYPGPHDIRLDFYDNPNKPWKRRWRCKTCGANVASYNSKTHRWSVWGAQLARDDNGMIKMWETVKPTAHIFYGTRMLDINDGLGKWEGYEDRSDRIL